MQSVPRKEEQGNDPISGIICHGVEAGLKGLPGTWEAALLLHRIN